MPAYLGTANMSTLTFKWLTLSVFLLVVLGVGFTIGLTI